MGLDMQMMGQRWAGSLLVQSNAACASSNLHLPMTNPYLSSPGAFPVANMDVAGASLRAQGRVSRPRRPCLTAAMPVHRWLKHRLGESTVPSLY